MIPSIKLDSGAEMPMLGLGTFGSDRYSAAEVAQAVIEAAEVGYRHFDCASIYGNEREIGQSLQTILKRGIRREALWITSKVWNNRHHQVRESCEQSLRDLQLDVLDLYLVHWPFPNHHEKGVSVDSRDPHAVPFSIDRYLETWAQMEDLVKSGLVRHIGTSNMTVAKLSALFQRCTLRPSANELERHPHFQQPQLMEFLKAHNIVPIGYSPIGSPSRPERDRTADDSVDIEDPVIVNAARRLAVHPAIVCVLWQIQTGSVPIPFSVKRPQFEAMFRAVSTLRLLPKELEAIQGVDRRCRLIKGQVFLWPEASNWSELWDGE